MAFRADKDTNEVFELYVVPASGGAPPVKVSGDLVEGGDIDDFAWSPDGTRLAFSADKDVASTRELYVTPADGSAAP